MGQIWWSTYDPEYVDSDEETDIPHSDGQSIIYRETTTADKEAVMTAIEYFIHTGKLWDGIPWMKRWEVPPKGADEGKVRFMGLIKE